MRQTKPTRIVIAFVTGVLLGGLPHSLRADDTKLVVPPVAAESIAPPIEDAEMQKQFGRALRGEKVEVNGGILQNSLDATRAIGSVLDGSSLDPARAEEPSSRSESRNRSRGPITLQGTTFPPQDSNSRDNVGRVSNDFRGILRQDDRSPIAPPQLYSQNVTPLAPSQPVSQDDRFYTAEMLLRTARLLNEVSPSDPVRRQLVASMRAEAVRLLSGGPQINRGPLPRAVPPSAMPPIAPPRENRSSTAPNRLFPAN
ncbi:MAG: hypothetical protein AAFX06_01000 [Planctomycetota bacterium]